MPFHQVKEKISINMLPVRFVNMLKMISQYRIFLLILTMVPVKSVMVYEV